MSDSVPRGYDNEAFLEPATQIWVTTYLAHLPPRSALYPANRVGADATRTDYYGCAGATELSDELWGGWRSGPFMPTWQATLMLCGRPDERVTPIRERLADWLRALLSGAPGAVATSHIRGPRHRPIDEKFLGSLARGEVEGATIDLHDVFDEKVFLGFNFAVWARGRGREVALRVHRVDTDNRLVDRRSFRAVRPAPARRMPSPIWS
jgi:hypothetical protein